MHVEVYRQGAIHSQDYEKGKPLAPVHTITEAEAIGNWEQRKTGTFVQFWPDDTIFTETVYHSGRRMLMFCLVDCYNISTSKTP